MSHDDDQKTSRGSDATVAVFVVVAYLFPFFIVLIDEGVLRTFFFSKHLGELGKDIFRTVYFPFFKLFDP